MDLLTIISNTLGELIAPTTAAYVLAAIGLNIHFGMTGLMNMGQAGFMLLGAYGFAITQSMGTNMFTSICAAVALAVIYALLLGIPTLKLGPDYLAMVTLAAAEIIRSIDRSTAMTNFTGGSAGISPQDFTTKFEASSPLPDGTTTFLLWTYNNNIANSWWLRIVSWILVAIAALLCWRWFHSPWGRVLKGIREDENAIRSLGKNVTKYKMQALILGGIFGAIGGNLFGVPPPPCGSCCRAPCSPTRSAVRSPSTHGPSCCWVARPQSSARFWAPACCGCCSPSSKRSCVASFRTR